MESAADGSGVTVPLQNLAAGASTNVFCASCAAVELFRSNSPATWSLQSITGGVVSGDLVAAGDNKSATFTAHKAGSAAIQAVATAGTGLSGVQTVVAGAASQTTVESKADGTGVTVPLQSLTAGTPTNVFAIARDSQGNFVGNPSATWSLQSITGGVVSGDLTPASGTSATFTGHLAGSAVIQAMANSFTGQSGVITVTGGTVTQLIWSTQPGSATVNLPFGTQPVLKTADQFGNASTSGLAATQLVTVTLSTGTGPLAGTTSYNIGNGTGGSNGVVSFTNLQINSTGTGDQLTATASPAFGAPVSGAAVWLDASVASTVVTNGNGSVTNWMDLSGNGNNFGTVLGTGFIGYTNATTLSGRRTVTFLGTSCVGFLAVEHQRTAIRANPNISVFIVTKKRSGGHRGQRRQYQGPFAGDGRG